MSTRANDIIRKLATKNVDSSVSSQSTVATLVGYKDYSPDEYATPITWSGSGYMFIDLPIDKIGHANLLYSTRDRPVLVAKGTISDRFRNELVIWNKVIQFKTISGSSWHSPTYKNRLIDTTKSTDSDGIIEITLPDFGGSGISESEVEFTDPEDIGGQWFSPFDSINLQAAESVQEEIDKVLELAKPDVQLLHARLSDLFKISKEEPKCRVISPASIRFFRNFLEKNSNINTPSLFLADSGAVRAQWNIAPNKALALLFQPSGIAEYVLFAPDRRRPSITGDHAGSASWQSVLPSLKRKSKIDWLFSG